MQSNAILVAHTLEFLGNKLGSIVCDNYFWDTESCNNIGLDELDHYGSFDFSEGFSFGPLYVVFSYSQDEGFLFRSFESCFR